MVGVVIVAAVLVIASGAWVAYALVVAMSEDTAKRPRDDGGTESNDGPKIIA